MNRERNDFASPDRCTSNRREFIRTVSVAGMAAGLSRVGTFAQSSSGPRRKQALIAITLDLEMARNFPKWEDTHWDYEKGNLNDEAKRYAVEAAQRVKARGG